MDNAIDDKPRLKLLTKERLLWMVLVLLMSGWQGLGHYLHVGEPAMAGQLPAESWEGSALEGRVRELEIFRAGEQVTVEVIKKSVEKMDGKIDQVLVILASNNGRKPKQ